MVRSGLILVVFSAIAVAAQPQSSQGDHRIEGLIVDARGAALPRARVAIVMPNPPPAVFSDRAGRFLITSTTVPVTIVATKAGYARTSRVVTAELSGGNRGLRLQLPRGATITGHVTDRGGTPIPEVQVIAQAARPDGGLYPDRLFAETNDLGEYRFGGLAAGRYEITAQPPTSPVFSTTARESLERGARAGARVPEPTPGIEVSVRPGDESSGVNVVVDLPVNPPVPSQSRISPPPSGETGTGAIRGRVVAASGQPLRGASLRLFRVGMSGRFATSDAQGRFVFSDLPAGGYTVEAGLPGWVTRSYGQRGAMQQPKAVTVRDGGVSDGIDVVLTRGSAITGTVLDEYGEPLEGAAVTVLLRRFGPGRLMVLPIRVERRTDDRGRYRLFGLMPGSYFLAVSADGVLSGSAGYRANGYAPVYYPRATDIREAVPLQLGADGDLSDMDVVFTPSPVAPVTGVVLDTGGNPVRQGSVLISPSHRSGSVATLPRTAAVRTDGGFTIADVAPGDYVVQAFVAQTPERPEEFGAQFVTVTDAPPPGVVVKTTLGSTVTGRVVVEADTDAPAPDGAFSLMPIPADFDYAPVFGRGASLSLNRDGTFRMPALTGPTRFVLSSSGSWFVKSVTVRGVDVTDIPIDFGLKGEAFDDVEIVVSERGAGVTGRVVDERGVRVDDYGVVVVPRDRDKWFTNSRYLRTARPSQSGTFDVGGLPPGDYVVLAVDALDGNAAGGEWADPEFLEKFAAYGHRLTLQEGIGQSVTLPLIRR